MGLGINYWKQKYEFKGMYENYASLRSGSIPTKKSPLGEVDFPIEPDLSEIQCILLMIIQDVSLQQGKHPRMNHNQCTHPDQLHRYHPER
jgi:hypothetical protein